VTGSLCGISLCPLLGYSVMFRSVGQILCSDASHQRVSWVTVSEQGTDGQQHLGDGEGGAPVVLQDV